MLKEQTAHLLKILQKMIPGGVNSPIRSFPDLDELPLIIDRAEDSEMIDIDGNRYIDYCMSWGSIILGHCHPLIVRAAIEQIYKGTSYGTCTKVEADIAKLIVDTINPIEKLRFVNSGTEATMTALRLARGYMKRSKIIKFQGNYHGHVDALLMDGGSYLMHKKACGYLGVVDEFVKHTICLPYNDVEALKDFFNQYDQLEDVAAIIVEPIAGNMSLVKPSQEFMQTLRKITQNIGALLIFDEVINGFRVGLKGASEYFNIEPDLVCLGKIIGAGFPVAAVGGKNEIMDALAPVGSVFQAGTLSGNPLALSAGRAVVQALIDKDPYQALEHMASELLDPIRNFIEQNHLNIAVSQVGSMFSLCFGCKKVDSSHDLTKISKPWFARFFSHLFKKGIYFSPSAFETNFVSLAHTHEQIAFTSNAILEFLKKHKQNLR